MNTIQKELNEAKNKMIKDFDFIIDKDNSKRIVELTRENVAIVEAMIRNDSAYIKSSDVDSKPSKGYNGSTAYWMTLLKDVFISHRITEYTYDVIVKNAIISVDRENSTHLNADKCGRDVIKKRISKLDCNYIIKCLKEPEYDEMGLFRIISAKTKGGRTNPSFASKFCHYACYYIFEGTQYQDNYSIYDNVMRKVLPYYIKYYKLELRKYNLKDYSDYRKAVDDIRKACNKATGEDISRNGFDHLLWYYHKGRL